MSRYAIHLHTNAPSPYFTGPVAQPIENLAGLVAGLIVQAVVPDSESPFNLGYQVAVELERPSHDDAVCEIDNAIRQLGLDVLQMFVEEVVSEVLAGASVGTALGGAVGAISENIWGMVAGAAAGALLGAALGDAQRSVKARYRADLVDPFRRVWQFTDLPLHPSERLAGA
jgi:hypothetical protein